MLKKKNKRFIIKKTVGDENEKNDNFINCYYDIFVDIDSVRKLG